MYMVNLYPAQRQKELDDIVNCLSIIYVMCLCLLIGLTIFPIN